MGGAPAPSPESVSVPSAQTAAARDAPAGWQAPLAHDGEPASLERWWAQFGDPVLSTLIAEAQAASPGLAQAGARIAEARELLARSGAAAVPALDVSAARLRGPVSFGGAPFVRTQDTALLQSSWEIDLFGGLDAARRGDAARLQARAAAWHEARVSIAAETAGRYATLRACEAQMALERAELASREASARLAARAVTVGLQAPAASDLAQALVAEQGARLQARSAQCELSIKALVALTGADEPALRARLAPGSARLPAPAAFAVDRVPARVLAQRPDIAAAERELVGAQADLDAAAARSLPRLAISGAIGPLRFDAAGVSLSGTTWSLGPTLSVPLFDAGVRAASRDSARARLDAAQAAWAGRVRDAVREVEEALLRLEAAARQTERTDVAAAAYRRSLGSVQARRVAGFASDVDLEEARRIALAAESALLALAHERVQAWIALYRAAGGGWSPQPQDVRR